MNNINDKKKRLTLWLSPQVITKAKTLALQYHVPVSQFIESLVLGAAGVQQTKEEWE